MLSKFMGSRLQLLDADKNKLVGMADGTEHSVLRPIQQGKRTVGWLVLQPNELVSDQLAQLFVKQQIRNNYRIAALSLCLAVWGAFILSRKLLKPIKRLAAGAKALVTGAYSVQIEVDSQDELGQLANDFNLLARTLKRNEAARKHWIADISHELRTPLAILRGEIEAVQDGVRALSQENIQSLHAEVLNLTQLVDDIHELSLSDLGTSHYQLEAVDVDACLQDVVQSFLTRFQERHLTLRYRPATGEAIVIEADARRLRQLFVNILENSRRYTDPGGFCEIQLYGTGERVVVNVEDTPPGVPDWSLAKLFERLYRVDKSRNRELGGSGLGLAICKAIVNAHQGDIHASQSRYGGLGINITLPLKIKPVNPTR
jgi:two-component system sensor histidine kinase BaeS